MQINSDDPRAAAALHITRTLQAHGHEAFLVGGVVRDLLLHRNPEDYDVATSATPDQVRPLFQKVVPVGEKFGVLIIVMDHVHIEVATFRTESSYSDRRRPDKVEFSSAKEDALRRDFTINALFMNPETGKVIDYVQGQEDLESHLIRCVGDPAERFSEDALRLLRAIRFASSLGFEIEKNTWAALRQLNELILHISWERIRDELIKGFTRSNPHRFLVLLDKSGLMKLVLPELLDMKGCEQPPQFHPEGDVFTHTKLMLSLLKPSPSVALAFATLLHDVGKPATAEVTDRIRFNNHHKVGAEIADRICRRLMFSNEIREKVVFLVSRHMDFINLPRMRESTLRRFLASEVIEDELELHRVDCLGSHGDLENYNLARDRLHKMQNEDQSSARLPAPLINGEDLKSLGVKPGPIYKTVLNQVYDAQLESEIQSREEALQMARQLVESGTG